MPTITAVLIVKNEQKNIEACLAQLATAVDEIVVVDTGSQDNTLDIARKFSNHCHTFNWIDDFAAARNFATEKASSDYILSIDADEYLLHPKDARKNLHNFIQQHPTTTLGTIQIINQVGTETDQQETIDHTRRFFCKNQFHFQGPIHEQIVPRDDAPTENHTQQLDAPTHLTLKHTGYAQSPQAHDHKAHRNIRLLKKALTQYPNDEYYQYQLGKAHYTLQQFPQAITALEDALRNIHFNGSQPPQGQMGPLSRQLLTDLIVSLAYAYANSNNLPTALNLLHHHHSLQHQGTQRADFQHVRGYIYLMLGDIPNATQAYTAALEFGPQGEDVRGTGTYSTAYHLGLISEANQDLHTAINYQHQALTLNPNYRPAIARCIDLITEGPHKLPKKIWNIANQKLFTEIYIEKLKNFLNNQDLQNATNLVTEATTLSPELLTRCKTALQQFVQ